MRVARALAAKQPLQGLDCAIVGPDAPQSFTALDDTSGAVTRVLVPAGPATAWLIRPDGYLIGRLNAPTEDGIVAALARVGGA